MQKSILKYCVDVMMYIDFLTIAIIGLIMEFIIPNGQTPLAKKYFLGLHRHEWGGIHFFLGVFFLILLLIHLLLNWTYISQATKKYFGDHWQKALIAFSGAWIAILTVSWLAIKL